MSKKATGFAMDLVVPATRVKTTVSEQHERGALVALFATPIADVGRYGDIFINVFLRTGGAERTAGQIVLISDYIYEAHSASWDGVYPLMENTFLAAEAWSAVATTIRITGTVDTEG